MKAIPKVTIDLNKCDYCDIFENPNLGKRYQTNNLSKCEVCNKDICKDHTDEITFEVKFDQKVGYNRERSIKVNVCENNHRKEFKLMEIMSEKLLSKKIGKYSSEW